MADDIAHLRPCPFCGGEATAQRLASRRWLAGCVNDRDCFAPDVIETTQKKAVAAWNRRPATDVTADRVAALEAGLEPFADISGEGDEDFADDRQVTVKFGRTTHYALTLGDLRRARALLTGENGSHD